ncbi:MAG TPA: hypothetical protein VGA64_10180 [Candidatus Polarisedimenticolia bacterium]
MKTQASRTAGGQDARSPQLERQYRHAKTGALVADLSGLGRLSITGKDAIDLLHRLTTQDLKDLRVEQGTAALFVTAKGRILDRVLLARLEDRILATTGPGRATAVRDWIERYTFREEVVVEDRTASHGTLGLFGAGAPALAAGLFGEAAARGSLHEPHRVAWQGTSAILARTDPLAGEGYLLTSDRAALQLLQGELLHPERGAMVAGPECLEVLRIEAGQPAAGRELTEEFNPWEAGLRDAVSLNKGCYVGQEVIARLNTYQKVSKFLARLAWEGREMPEGRAALEFAGQPVGTLTSAARVPASTRVVALGYLAGEQSTPGLAVDVVWDDRRARGIVEGVAR